jgi:hypothetical protein
MVKGVISSDVMKTQANVNYSERGDEGGVDILMLDRKKLLDCHHKKISHDYSCSKELGI